MKEKKTDSGDKAYQVYDRDGRLMMSCPESCRYPRNIEQSLMDNGYTIKLNGKKITRKEIKEK